ncbi:MAG: UvrD-helicase domain-containing protein, partial [Deltaproteobacteria bacterium]|nr:UvrD-helicase domain-containing protein [Deltaproteobacteria bacterium]
MELTESQLEAASSIDQSVAVIAAAGSGKTSVLVERCLRAIQAGVPFEKLLIITFTEKAAGELKHRLSQHLPQALKTSLTDAWIGTFHAFCTRILSRHASLLHINPQFRILDEGAGRLLTHQAAQTTFLSLLETGNEHAALLVEALEFRNVIGLLEDLMAFRWHSQQLFSHGTLGSPEDQPLLTAVTHCFTKACDELQRYFHDAGQLDFQALETMTLHLFTSHPDILHMYQERFRHLFVDEYQDT